MTDSIQKKLRRMLLAISAVVLLLAVGTFVTYEVLAFRKSHKQIISTVAAVLADNCNSSLVFQDVQDGERLLTSLRTEPTIHLAVLYDTNRTVFALYPTNTIAAALPKTLGHDRNAYENGKLVIVQPVRDELQKRVGTLYLEADLSPLYQRLQLYSLLVLLVLFSSFIVAWLLSFWMQKRVSNPILALAQTAAQVTERKDFSIRARRYTDDEIGGLTDAFNSMLAEIGKRAQALRESEQRFRNMADAAPVMIWTSGPDNQLDYLNKAWLEFTGRKIEQEVGTGWAESVHPDDVARVLKTREKGFASRRPFDSEFRLRRADGEYRVIRGHGIPRLAPDGSFGGYIGTCLDITDIRQAQLELERRVESRTAELAETNRELEAFTYSVSHDLRAPLRHINAYAQVLEEDYAPKFDAEGLKYLQRIQEGARRMGSLVDDLLNLARVGRQEIKIEEYSLDAIVKDVLQDLSDDNKDRRIEWRISPLGSAPCDPGLMKQVFTNLVSNAVKYSRPREVAVIEVDRKERAGEIVYMVRDNGVGFDMKYVNKLFGVFQRLHRAEEFEGTGVGLAIVERIIRRHGGRIWAEAAPDQGAAFYFTLGQSARENS